MVKKICNKPGCNRLVPYSENYCEEHKGNSFKGSSKGFSHRDWHSLYSSTDWKKKSKDFLRRWPACCVCGSTATVVDHIEPHRGDLNLFWNENNWQPMCKACHDRKTQTEINRRQKEEAFEYQRAKRNKTLHIHNVDRR